MIHRLHRILSVFVLWIIFCIGCIVAPFLAIVLPICKPTGYSRNFVVAADRMMAALLGFSGRITLSTECVHSLKHHRMHDMLNEIEPLHCECSAVEEASYCRLSDRRLGDK